MADTKDTQGTFSTNNNEAKQQDNHSETAASGGDMRIILIAVVSIALCIGAWLLNKFM